MDVHPEDSSATSSSTWIPATLMENPDWVLGSWLWPGKTLAVVGAGEVNQWVAELSISIALIFK